jgi:hypothetical protein
MNIMIPPFMLPYRRKTKEELALEKKQAMASKIMQCLTRHQPKKKRKKK